ncbi:hypothetical protein EDC94DRAFT_611957 [Helicostylum pulchrum]|nr:hypothetical protein EDC94DRAFT_611957 [Helicostylum pulchrum]
MSSLPHEVLTLIFDYLVVKEILPCQLTCKQWHKASLTCLYSHQFIHSDKDATLYVRTISNSPHLGKYLNSIAFENIFEKNSEGIVFDKHGIVDVVIRYCPNVIRIQCIDEEDFPFWTQLMYAASQGQLSHLKSLPQCSSASLESYIYTALSFKNSLATLELYDDSSCFGPQVARLGAYQTLCDQMDQFEKLETLRLNYVSDKYLSYFDGLIDKCHHLKEVNFNIIVKDIQQPPNDEPESKIHPRPDVRTFECNWGLINVKSQLEYVMYKFPNLETLRVNESETDEDDVVNCSGPTLIKFIQYIMSVSDFYIHMDIKEEDLLNIWNEFRKGKNGSKKLSIAYSFSNSWSIGISANRGIIIRFPAVINDDDPSHIRFFSGAGETVQSITIDGSARSISIDWLFDILQLCSFIEEITIKNLSYLSQSRNTLKYPSVKRLKINLLYYTNSNIFLSCLSLNLPNINQLSFKVYAAKDDDTEPITIHMPHSSLDSLTWLDQSYSMEYFKGTEVYIKLKTDAGTKFYVGIRNMLFEIESDRYLFFSRHTRFDISCKHLKELRIKRNIAPESDANLVF